MRATVGLRRGDHAGLTLATTHAPEPTPSLRPSHRHLAAVLLQLLSLAVLGGWLFHVGVLKTVLPGLTTMKANTAVALGATGVALGALSAPERRRSALALTLAASALVALIGAATLLEYAAHLDLGLDELLFADPDTTSRPFSGRMSPATAASFVAVGLSLGLLAAGRSRAAVAAGHALAVVPAWIGLLSLAAYAYGVSQLHAFGPYLAVALHTAAGLVTAAAGLLALRSREGWAAAFGGRPIARAALLQLAATAVAAPLLTGALVVAGVRAGWYHPLFAPAVFAALSAATFTALAFRSAAVLARAEAGLSRARAEALAADGELAASLERHRALVEGLPQLVWTCLPDGACNYLSPQWVAYTGAPEAEQLGFGWLRRIHPDDADRSRAHWLGAVAGEHPYDIEYRIRGADGGHRWFKARGTPIRDAEGRITYWFGSCTDVQEIVEAREVLARSGEALQAEAVKSEGRYRLLADTALDVIGRYALDGRLLYISPACQDVLGYTPEELVGRRTTDLIHPDDRDRVRAQFARHLAAPGAAHPIHTEHRALRKDGRVIWLEGRPRLVRDAQGAPVEFQDVMRDVTARKAMEGELEEARVAAEAASQAKSDFLANMSHELRTPLTAILGYADVLEGDARLFADGRVYARRVRDAGSSLLALVDDVLDLAKIEATGLQLHPRPVEVGRLLRSALDLVRPLAQAKALALDLDWDVASLTVEADPDRLRQVLVNLLGNAVKFTPAGGVRLRARCAREGAAAALELAVSDTGVGIPAERLAGIFDRFEQADASTSRRFGGTGLGLTISQAIAQAMGGRIDVASRPGEGTTFTVHLTLARAEDAREPGRLQAPDGTTGLSGLRVLVAEDVEVNRDLIALLLKPLGVELEMACDGAEAVAAAARTAFDLILMDMQMPVLDGVEAVRRIRAGGGASAGARILALTANVLGPEVESCLAAGMDGHIGKPFSVAQLVSALGRPHADRSEAGVCAGSALQPPALSWNAARRTLGPVRS